MATLLLLRIPICSKSLLPGKQATLDRFRNVYRVYDSIAIADLNGNVIAQSQGASFPTLEIGRIFSKSLKPISLSLTSQKYQNLQESLSFNSLRLLKIASRVKQSP
jgi:hypothetical protein